MTIGTPTRIQPVLVPATVADEPMLRAIHAETYGEQFAAAQLEPAMLESLLRMQYDAQHSQYRAAYPDSVVRLIVVDGDVAGHCWTDISDTELRLIDIAVRPAFRRRGVAAAVVQSVIHDATVADVPVVLSVWTDNAPARRLYAGLGFVATSDESTAGYVTLRSAEQ